METVGLQERLREPEMVETGASNAELKSLRSCPAEGMRQQRMIGRDAFPALRELI